MYRWSMCATGGMPHAHRATLPELRTNTGPSPAAEAPNADQSISSQRTAPPGTDVIDAGILKADICQKPAAVGASGSRQVNAKDFVPSGIVEQGSGGSSSVPPSPILSITERVGSRSPSWKSSLVRVISCNFGNGA